MTLFEDKEPIQIIPFDGEAYYYSNFYSVKESRNLFLALQKQIYWQQEKLVMFGKKIIMNRKVSFYADQGISYTYANKLKESNLWIPFLLDIKKKIEDSTQETFNCCLLNYYPTGEDGMSWHSDNERELGLNPVIASISLGAKRKFVFKHMHNNTKKTVYLDNGSLLLMKGTLQHYWKHSLPKTKKIFDSRINLTFRNIVQ